MMRFKHTSQSTCSDDGLWMSLPLAPLSEGEACGDYGKEWYEQNLAVYELAYWDVLDGSAAETLGKYNVQAGFVSLDDMEANRGALKSSGWEFVGPSRAGDDNQRTMPWREVAVSAHPLDIWCPYSGDVVVKYGGPEWCYCLAECLWQCGAKEVVCDVSGNNRRALIREARGAL